MKRLLHATAMRSVTRWWLACWTALALPAMGATLHVTVLDEQGKPVPQAAVFLESAAAARAVQPLAHAEIAQAKKAFSPSVLVVPVGTPVAFPNRDTVRHHVYSFSPAKRFELKLYLGTPTNPVLFDKPGIVVLGCNIHDQMLAHVVVVETPWYGLTDAAGNVSLRDVPAGAYRLRTWHSRLPVGAAAQEQAQRLEADASSAKVVLRQLAAP